MFRIAAVVMLRNIRDEEAYHKHRVPSRSSQTNIL
jgi:hypothetical protein